MQLDISHILIESFFQTLIALKPLLPYILLIVGIKLFFYFYYQYRYSKAGIEEIDKMSGHEFELYLTNLFERLGYKVHHSGRHNNDYGCDVIIEKDGKRTAIQAKRRSHSVGEPAIQEIYSSLNVYNCQQAVVLTNGFFTNQAQFLARRNNVMLWDRNKLIDLILEAKRI